jgi:hypothetical protein
LLFAGSADAPPLLAGAAAGATVIRTAAGDAAAGEVLRFGLRRVSDAGVVEPNTHVLALLRRVDEAEFEPVLARPREVELASVGDRTVLGWRFVREPGTAAPDRFIVETCVGGAWSTEPAATLTGKTADAADYVLELPADVEAARVTPWRGAQPGGAVEAILPASGAVPPAPRPL